MVNPVDAHRKAEKAKQIKKQKADKKRDAEAKEKLDKEKADTAKKERRKQELEAREAALARGKKIRNPKRSIYYDEVFNPYGNPPPGQPYLEYPTKLELEEINIRNAEVDAEEDLAIPLPVGSPPKWANLFTEEDLANMESEEETPPPEEKKSSTSIASAKIASPVKLHPAPSHSAVISAAPVLRDFQSELKRLVPTKLLQKVPPRKEQRRNEQSPGNVGSFDRESPSPYLEEEEAPEAYRSGMFDSLPAPKQKNELSNTAPLAGILDYSESEDEDGVETNGGTKPGNEDHSDAAAGDTPMQDTDPDYDDFQKEMQGLV